MSDFLESKTIARESFKYVAPHLDRLVNMACDLYEAGNKSTFALTGSMADEISASIRAEYAELDKKLAAAAYTKSLEIAEAVAPLKLELAKVMSDKELMLSRQAEKHARELSALQLEKQKLNEEFKTYSVQANGAFEVLKSQLAASQEREKLGGVLSKMYGGANTVGGVVKGEMAEEHIYNALCEPYYMGAIVKRVGKTSHTCDISFNWRTLNALIEVKNYSGTIPESEFLKFERDLLGQGQDINCGLFISMANRNIGKYNTFAHSWLNDRILMVYMFLDGNITNIAYAIDCAIGIIEERKRAEESVSGDEDILIAKFKEYHASLLAKHKNLDQQIKHHTSMLASLNAEIVTVAKTLTDLNIACAGKTWLSDSEHYIASGDVMDEKMQKRLEPLFDYVCAGNQLNIELIKSFLAGEAEIIGVENVRITLMEMIARNVINPGGYEQLYGKYKAGKDLQLVKLQEMGVINSTKYKLLKFFGKPLNIIKDSFDRYVKKLVAQH